MKSTLSVVVVLLGTSLSVLGTPARRSALEMRAAPDNTVHITDASNFCIVVPRDPHTNIGDSEHPGGMTVYCSAAGHSDPTQGTLSDDFWSNVDFQTGKGSTGAKYAQLTGCIRPNTLDRLNPKDGGGQYDSSGGDGGQGNPRGSICTGYNHYVELLEPSNNRACIKCCDEYNDCPLNKDTSGCPAVIQGNYFDCTA